MFSQACVKNSVHMGEVYTPWTDTPPLADTLLLGRQPTPAQTPHSCADTPLGRHAPGQTPPSWADIPNPLGQTPLPRLGRHPAPADGYCSGRYASYWNAFLFCSMSPVYSSCMIAVTNVMLLLALTANILLSLSH